MGRFFVAPRPLVLLSALTTSTVRRSLVLRPRFPCNIEQGSAGCPAPARSSRARNPFFPCIIYVPSGNVSKCTAEWPRPLTRTGNYLSPEIEIWKKVDGMGIGRTGCRSLILDHILMNNFIICLRVGHTVVRCRAKWGQLGDELGRFNTARFQYENWNELVEDVFKGNTKR